MAGPTVTFTVRLRDQFSGFAGRLKQSFAGVAHGLRGVETHAVAAGSRLDKTLQRLANMTLAGHGLSRAAARLGGAIGRNIAHTADFDDRLQAIGQTGELTTTQLAELRKAILALAPVLGRKPGDILGLVEQLTAEGLDPAKVRAMIEPLGRVAVGQRADLADIAKAGIALVNNLEVDANRLEAVFDKLATAGKRGKFELKNMAQFLSGVAAAAAGQGMKGEPAAAELASALQIVAKATGRNSEAATALTDLILKSATPETVKRYRKHGVDIRKAIDDGLKSGKSPLMTIVEETHRLLGADPTLRVTDFFADKQALTALTALTKHYEEFIRVNREVAAATGVIQEDFEAMSTTTKAALDQVEAASDSLSKTWGGKLSAATKRLAGSVRDLNVQLKEFLETNQKLSTSLAFIGAGLVGLGSFVSAISGVLLGLASLRVLLKGTLLGGAVAGLGRLFLKPLVWMFGRLRFLSGMTAGVARGFVSGFAGALAAGGLGRVLATWWAGLALRFAAYKVRFYIIGTVLGRSLRRGLLVGLTGRIGLALLAGDLIYTFRNEIKQGLLTGWEWLKEVGKTIATKLTESLTGMDLDAFKAWADDLVRSIRERFAGMSLADAGRAIGDSLLAGLKSCAEKVLGWADWIASKLKSTLGITVSPRYVPPAGPGLSDGPVHQQSAPGGLVPAPAGRSASLTQHISIKVDGADPERAARAIVRAIDGYRQRGLYDGALA